MNAAEVDWIAVDWGTTRLRAWAVDAADVPLGSASSEAGMGALAPDAFEPALLELVGGWLDGARTVPVLACGMVGARQGWVEAPYAPVPCPPVGPAAPVRAPTTDPRIECRVVPGLGQGEPADVMRGEETQLGGLLAAEPGFDGVACLPGTHSKWVRLAGGEVRAFRTCMTGELFAALGSATVLRHSVAGDARGDGRDEDRNDEAFARAVGETLDAPASLAASLFGLRAADLLHGEPRARLRARLSGLLLGAELAATRHWWTGVEVALVGAPALAARYAGALSIAGGASRTLDADALTLAGLVAAHRRLPGRDAQETFP